MTHDEIRLLRAWAENALDEVRALKSIPELDAWIVANNQKLGAASQDAPSAWESLKNFLHAKDGELRAENIRQGVG